MTPLQLPHPDAAKGLAMAALSVVHLPREPADPAALFAGRLVAAPTTSPTTPSTFLCWPSGCFFGGAGMIVHITLVSHYWCGTRL